MEVLSLVGGSLLSATFDLLFEKLNEYLSDQLRHSKEEVRAQMESWKTLLPKITVVLQHAEENQVTNRLVKSFLDDLRDLAYDMEDILEEFVIDAKRSELIAKSKASTSKGQKVKSSLKNLFRSQAKPNRDINCRLKDITNRLQRIEKDMHTLGPINSAMEDKKKSHITVERLPESSLLEDKVLGRDSDKDAILRRLLEDGGSLERNLVIPIVGMGGVGKTTLARLIYNDEKLEGRFDLKAWVCVSDEFDVARITRTILEHVTGDKCDSDFGLLQEKLKGKLAGRKFFLVLDDVWNKKYGPWDVLKRPFMSGAPGSKIIVTTRHMDVGTMMRGDDGVYNLELLQDDACLPLFTWHALGEENFGAHPDLQDVGKKLVMKCKRLPLALKTLGGVLRGKPHRGEWENILNSEIWSSSEDGILPTLRLSYNHLPSHLKRCFAYCALFPRDYEFDKKELVLLWMAEGLLQQQSHGKKQMEEEIGHEYFDELLSRSLFEKSSRVESRFVTHEELLSRLLFEKSSRDESWFVMHDLINDLAVNVAGEIYCNLEHGMGDEKLEKARHLSFIPHTHKISKRYTVLNKLKYLRTLLQLRPRPLNCYSGSHLSNRVLHDFLPALNRLRVLSLCNRGISKLPDSFETLKHIRYINLSITKIKCLPESVGSLLFLQTLLLRGCHQLTKLPTTIGNLIDLHHLDVSYTPCLTEMPSEIGELKNLVTLSKLIVGKASGMMRLSNLKNLLQLQGRLSILNLQNVLVVQDAREASLDKIHGLEELVLDWTSSEEFLSKRFFPEEFVLERAFPEFVLERTFPDNDGDKLVLSCLKPHSNLKSLKISSYGGKSFPNWVCDPLLFSHLSSMELNNCKRCTSLPSFGMLPILKKLIIKGMEVIEVVGSEFYKGRDSFPSLEELVFENMLNWKKWTSPTESEGEFPCLRRLVIQNCPKLLGQLPSNLSSLKELDVRNCNAMLLKSMGDLTSLANLRIGKISELTCLPKSFSQSLTALETLYIGDCNDLTCLWEEGAEIEQSLLPFNLKHLSLKRCGALQSLPDAMMMRMDGSSSSNTNMLMSRLEKLEISGCDSLKSFPRGKLPIRLKYLKIKDCKGCHQLLASLKEFVVTSGCEHLESFPETMLQHYTGLQSISIQNCKILKSLPTLDCLSSLVRLSIFMCEVLESLPEDLGSCTPSLKDLSIERCENFKSLPNTMYRLKSFQSLAVGDCPSIEFIPDGGLPPNLIDLQVYLGENLKCVPNSMYQLTSLQILGIPGGVLTMGLQNLTSLQWLSIQQKLPLDIVLPSSLTTLHILTQENLESIPEGLFQNLSSLEELLIVDCPELRSLPREPFPPSLQGLYINKCPHLKRERFEAEGDYWTLTRGIPCVRINGEEVDY